VAETALLVGNENWLRAAIAVVQKLRMRSSWGKVSLQAASRAGVPLRLSWTFTVPRQRQRADASGVPAKTAAVAINVVDDMARTVNISVHLSSYHNGLSRTTAPP
jgi:hypothetical protein